MEILIKIICLIFCHFVGDYLFQTDYLAGNKGKDWYLLIAHCVLYSLPFALVFGITWQLAVVFVLHIIVDSLKARWKLIPLWADQLIHYATCLLYLI